MNKAQKQVQQAELDAEKQLIKELTAVYRKARQDCETKISELSSRSDMENLQSVVYQQKYQEAIKKQIDEALKGLQTGQYDKIHNFTADSYNNGYIGAMYDIQQQGIPMTVPIDQRKVEKALKTDSKLSKGLYNRLGEDYNLLKTRIRTNLSRGVVQGQSWNDIAKNIAGGMNSPFKTAFNSAVRIARTEGHRVQQSASYDAMNVAKEKGADVLKQWDSTLDDKTRDTHRMLDGQIRELDEPFEVEGMKAMFPSDFGIASEDINCRCCVLQRARWALDEDELETLKERAEYFGLDKSEDFEDYKEKYLKLPENADIIEISTSERPKDFDELEKHLEDKYKITMDEAVRKLDFQSVNEALGGIEAVIAEFPEIGNMIKTVETGTSGVMSCSGTMITFNPNDFTSYQAVKDMHERSSKANWWIKNATITSTGSHEAGHAVEWLLIDLNPNYTYEFEKIIAWNDCEEAKKIVSQACKDVKKTPYGKGKTNSDLKAAISEYAERDTASETMAEAFADYFQNGVNANPLSKRIFELTKETYNNYKEVKTS